MQRMTWVPRAIVAIAALLVAPLGAQAGTVAYWRFETGPAGTNVTHPVGNGVYNADVLDVSGNGNHLSAWTAEDWAGYRYDTDVPTDTVLKTAAANDLAVRNAGGNPGMFTQTGAGVSTMSPAAWTVEASFKLENGGFRTVVGRDSRGATPSVNGDLAALYLQAIPNNGLAIKFADVSGYWHEAVAPNNTITTFDNNANPSGSNAPWYHVAAVSDGSTLSLYLALAGGDGPADYQLVALKDLTLSGSPNTALSAGTGDGGDWDAGNWSVGRGLYAGGHGDRAWGFIDEVRISDSALAVRDFLHIPEPSSVALALGVTALVGLCARKRK